MWGMESQDLQGKGLWQGHRSLRLCGGLHALLEACLSALQRFHVSR